MPASSFLKTLESWESPTAWLDDVCQITPIIGDDIPVGGKLGTRFGFNLNNGVFNRYHIGPREVIPLEHLGQFFTLRANGNPFFKWK